MGITYSAESKAPDRGGAIMLNTIALNDDAVVITGLGLLTPIGTGKECFWKALLAGENGLRPITAFDTSRFRTHRGGEVQNFDAAAYCRRVKSHTIGRGAQLAIAASRLALEDSGVPIGGIDPSRIAVTIGTTMGESQIAENIDELSVSPSDRLRGLYHPSEMIPAAVAREFRLNGPVNMISTACAAGNYSIGHGADLLEAHEVDLAIVGGADPFSRVAFAGFNSMHAVTPEFCQPFDRLRKGMAVSEGAAMLVLERYGSARKRGASIYARVAGYGISNDAHHMTAPHPDGRGAVRSMLNAVAQAGVPLDAIDYINAHGTGTPANDRIETMAIKRAFGESAYRTPVSSIKSMLGHTMGAASAIEAVACALSIQHGVLPPTMNYWEKDPECDLDYVPNSPREKRVGTVLSNSFAFGGNCAALVLQKV
jgi:3-oxoacyl-[acyl-carrier-protein] synthase II